MTTPTLTIDPEDVLASVRDTSALPSWLEKVASYVQQAASEGETVTLTAKQRMLTPEQVAACAASHTGRYLAGVLRPRVSAAGA